MDCRAMGARGGRLGGGGEAPYPSFSCPRRLLPAPVACVFASTFLAAVQHAPPYHSSSLQVVRCRENAAARRQASEYSKSWGRGGEGALAAAAKVLMDRPLWFSVTRAFPELVLAVFCASSVWRQRIRRQMRPHADLTSEVRSARSRHLGLRRKSLPPPPTPPSALLDGPVRCQCDFFTAPSLLARSYASANICTRLPLVKPRLHLAGAGGR